jgi:hypothetical protein
MGFSISWMAFRDLSKGDVLARMGFRDLGELDRANEAPFSIAELPDRWILVFSNDFKYGAPENVRRFADGATVVSCQVDEHVMVSAAHCLIDRAHAWSVSHDGGELGPYDLEVTGEPPPALHAMKQQLFAEQDANGGEGAKVDFGFDVPVQLAMELTGYLHDRWSFPWGEPAFTVIEPKRWFRLPFLRRG